MNLSRSDANALAAILSRAGYPTGNPPDVWGPTVARSALPAFAADVAAGRVTVTADAVLVPPAAPARTGTQFEGIIDINHNNPYDLTSLRTRGVSAIVHKATEGVGFADPLYSARKAAALAAGMLWGAYHFAAYGDGAAQARYFLTHEGGTDPRILLALDFEPSSHGPNMTLAQAHDFVSQIYFSTRRYPVIYGGGGLLRDLLEGKSDPLLANCPLWLADYRAHPQTIAPTWPRWTLLQYKEDQGPRRS